MKYRVSAAVQSTAQLASNIRAEAGEDEYFFNVDDEGLLVQVAVQRRVTDFQDLLPVAHFDSAGVLNLEIRHETASLHLELIEALQYVESVGSLLLSIQRMRWQDARWEWIPETEEEQGQVVVLSGDVRTEYPSDPTLVTPAAIGKLLAAKPRLNDLMTVPMAFFREGSNEFTDQKYAMAFMHFYLYLEHMYGNGKTRNADIEREFLSANHVRDGIAYWLDFQATKPDETHLLRLRELLSERKWPFDTEHVARLLVRLRAEVHHSSRTKTTRQGHPLNHDQYRTIAHLCSGICLHVNAGRNLVTFRRLKTGHEICDQ